LAVRRVRPLPATPCSTQRISPVRSAVRCPRSSRSRLCRRAWKSRRGQHRVGDPFTTGRREFKVPSTLGARNSLILGGAGEDGRCDCG
jgi:hypothetical protein